MPTYEYACKSCGAHLEVVQSFTDDALTECPECSGTLRKVFSPVGITFKGSGFYKTDSRSGSGRSGGSEASGGSGSSSGERSNGSSSEGGGSSTSAGASSSGSSGTSAD